MNSLLTVCGSMLIILGFVMGSDAVVAVGCLVQLIGVVGGYLEYSDKDTQ